MRSQPQPGEASRRRAEEQFKTTKKVNSETKAKTRHGKPRRRKRRAYAHFGWLRKQPTRILQIAAPRQRRPADLSRAGAFEDLRPQPQNPSKARLRVLPRRLRCSGRHRHGPKSADVGRSDRAVPVSGGDTHAYLSLRQPGSLLAGHMLHKPGDPLAGFDFARLAPYLPALAEV